MVNAEDTLNEANKLDLRLTLNEKDKKELTIISYKPVIDSGKYYIKEKINTKSVRITSNIVNFILNSQSYWSEIIYNNVISDYYFNYHNDYYFEIDLAG